MRSKKLTSLALTALMTASLLAGCGSESGKAGAAGDKSANGSVEVNHDELYTVDFYDL